MATKKQVIVLHGAGAFARLDRTNFIEALKREDVDLAWFTRSGGDWKAHMQEHLGDGYEVFTPKMPDPDNPFYEAWKIWFEKILEKMGEEVILVGHSLGGAFLLKYLSETRLSKKITGLFIVAAPYPDNHGVYVERGFSRPEDMDMTQAEKLFFYYSVDDKIVPIRSLEQFRFEFPQATFRELDGRGHFNKDDFPEIVEDIQSL